MMQYIDVNECLDNNGGCSDNCTNTNGSYYCSCFSGFELLSDNHTCEGNKQDYACIVHNYWHISNTIREYSSLEGTLY